MVQSKPVYSDQASPLQNQLLFIKPKWYQQTSLLIGQMKPDGPILVLLRGTLLGFILTKGN